MSRMRSRYRAGDWVEVRSKEEIFATLDEKGAYDNLPFMPEMLAHCGNRFRVAASAHKTCDTVHQTGGRRMRDAVHLEDTRCDGSAHDGCQARCTFFWKEAWLRPASGAVSRTSPASADLKCDEERLVAATRQRTDAASGVVYVCQATALFAATTPLATWSPLQYWADIRSRNENAVEAAKVLFLASVFRLRDLPFGFRLSRWLYEKAHYLIRKTPNPYATGRIPRGDATPHTTLDLKAGEICVVKPHDQILNTLDQRNRNRGLYFDKEMVRYCGHAFKVGGTVERIINESTGEMLHMPTRSVILEGAYCMSRYSEKRLLCPRRLTPFWREAWLERVTEPLSDRPPPGGAA